MPKLPRTSARKIIAALKRMGFVEIRKKGSHIILKKKTPEGEVGCVIPEHEELAVGTLASLLRQAKIDPDEFLKHL